MFGQRGVSQRRTDQRTSYRPANYGRSIGLLILCCWGVFRFLEVQRTSIPPGPEVAYVQVVRVIDGDTLLIAGGQRVRLLGMNTPETKHPTRPPEPFGPEASLYTKSFVEGKTVQLVFDRERYDNYQRLLAFVFLDEKMLNEELVLAGLAIAEPRYPFRSDYKKRLIAAEKSAQAAARGIWSLTPATHKPPR